MAKKKTKSVKKSSKKAKVGRPRGGPNRSDFIRSLPLKMPAKDVVVKGKARGLTITTGLVYVVRAKMAAGTPKRSPGRPRKDPRAISTRGRPAKSSDLSEKERQLAEMVLLIGLPRTEQLLSRLMKAFG